MGNPYDDYVSLLLIYVMYYTMKSVCVIAVILPKNQKTSSNMSEKNITFEDLPKAMSWLMDKLNELDSKIDGLNNQNQSVPTEQWMNLKELCDYIPSHPAEQTVYGWTSCHLIPFHKRGKRIMFLKSEIDEWLHAGKIKSDKNLEDEAAQFIKSKRNTKFYTNKDGVGLYERFNQITSCNARFGWTSRNRTSSNFRKS